MTSYERMMAVLERKIPDRAPWMEIGFHTKIAEKIIGENFEIYKIRHYFN